MKKLFTPPINLISFSLMLLFLVLNSCKKDILKTTTNNLIDNPTHQISNVDIQKWAKDNPVVKYLALDWKNAKQTVIQGRQVIKVGLLNESKIPTKNPQLKVNSTVKTNSETAKSFYNEKHKPEVFLIKDNRDSIHSYLLNFVPESENKNFGENKKWSGSLYEWNMNSDSLFVHHLNQNKTLERYILKKSGQSSELGKSNVKANSFWGLFQDMFNGIGGFFNDIGFFLGIPGTSGIFNDGYFGTRIWDFNWIGDLFSGEGGGYGNGNYNGYSGGSDFYGGYLPGYNGYNPVYSNYPINGGPSFDPNPIIGSAEAQELINTLNLIRNNDNKLIGYLQLNNVASYQLLHYLYDNGDTQENKDFIKWAIGYLADNTNVDFDDFKDEYLINKPNINDVVLPALIDTTGLSQFPKFKEILTNLPSFLNTYPNVRKALAYYTGFTEAEVMSKMQPGKGPKLIVISMAPNLYGHYDAVSKTLQINSSFVNGLEVAQLPKTIQATALLLAITTFHEFVHYGRDDNKLKNLFTNPNSGKTEESGWSFERSIDPNNAGLNKYNAIKWLDFYPFNF